jgi:histidine triad (HIT) family protein
MPAAACTFCSIVGGDLPAAVVLDEEDVLGFLDVRPVFPGHVLLVPRTHFGATRWAAMLPAMDADGTFVAVNNRVSQSVPHLHVHVVPRRFKDGLRGFFWPRQKYDTEAAMHEVAARIRSAVEG